MPLKLSVSFNRKTGEANFGSRGAGVSFDVEVESSLVGEPERLKERVRHLFSLAKQSVDEELAGGANPANGHDQPPSNGNGRRRDNTRRATASQVRALSAIADRHKIDLAALLVQRFQIQDPTALSITEASSLIDELKGAGNGAGGHR